jgi:Na+/proline symporter
MPDYIRGRFSGNRAAHISAVTACLGIDVVALLFNAFIGAFLLSVLAGIPTWVGIVTMMLVALTYSVWRGLPASVATDVVQLLAIIVIAAVITPWATTSAGGLDAVRAGLGGVTGEFGSLFNYDVFYSFGILATINLLCVPLVDQMFYQRAFACPQKNLIKTFLLGGALFAVVPIVLSLLGFIATQPAVRTVVEQPDFPKILANVAAVQQYLPTWTFFGFVLMAICALSSTLDSALCAIGSLWGQDIYLRYLNPAADENSIVRATRQAVVVAGVAVALLAILFQKYLNGDMFFNFNGVLASAVVPPLLLSVLWKRTAPAAVATGIAAAVLIGEPIMIWGSYHVHILGDVSKTDSMVLAAIGTPLLSLTLAAALSFVLPGGGAPNHKEIPDVV